MAGQFFYPLRTWVGILPALLLLCGCAKPQAPPVPVEKPVVAKPKVAAAQPVTAPVPAQPMPAPARSVAKEEPKKGGSTDEVYKLMRLRNAMETTKKSQEMLKANGYLTKEQKEKEDKALNIAIELIPEKAAELESLRSP